jgi:hypothetical protein
MFGTFPALSQSLEGATNTFPRNEAGSQPLLETDLGYQDNVHTLVSRAKSWGLRCSISRSASNVSSGKVVCSLWGREEPSSKTASPAALKLWMMLRTVCLWQPCISLISSLFLRVAQRDEALKQSGSGTPFVAFMHTHEGGFVLSSAWRA